MPEPNLPPLRLADTSQPGSHEATRNSPDIAHFRDSQPELPADTRNWLMGPEVGLSIESATQLVNEPEQYAFYHQALKLLNARELQGVPGDGLNPCQVMANLLQKNVLNRKRWATRDELRVAIIIWIEHTYHRRRRQRRLGKLTPIEFETIHQPALQAA